MIIWRGAGVIVIIITFLCSLSAEVLTNAQFGKGYWDAHAWPIAAALIIAGVIIWIISGWLSSGQGRVLRDEATGQKVLLKARHDFFFIPLKWWGPIVSLIGLSLLVFNVTPGKV